MFIFDRMDEKMVRAAIDTFPAEITVIDANDEVVAWNKHSNRLFHRPDSCMGMNFRECHPAESLHKVEQIIAEMPGRHAAVGGDSGSTRRSVRSGIWCSSTSTPCAATPGSTWAAWR